MNKKIRLTAAVISAAMMLSLCSCGVTDAVRGTTSTATDPVSSQDEAFSHGSSAGSVYTNSFLGISCDLGDGWTFYDDNQIAELNGMAADAAGSEYQKMLDNSKVIYDMFAMKDDSLASVNIVFEKLNIVNGVLMDEEQYIASAIGTLKSTFENMGSTNVSVEQTSFSFAGEDKAGAVISFKNGDVTTYEYIVCVKQGGYVASITVATYVNDNCQQLLDCFSKLG